MPSAVSDPNALRFRRAFLLVMVVGISLLFLLMIQRFLIAVFLAAIAAGVAQPIYRRFLERVGRPSIASILTLLLLLLGVGLPLSGFLAVVAAQAVQVGQDAGDWFQLQAGRLDQLQALLERIPFAANLIPDRAQIVARAGDLAALTGPALVGTLAAATRGTLSFLLQFFILLYALFYFLIDGPILLRRILDYTPLSRSEEDELLERFISVTRATLKGSLLIGVIQGGLAGLAFWVAGVPGPAFWGTIMIVLSIIPAVGAALVWIPAVVYLFLTGAAGAGVGLLVWCAVVVGTVDNFLRPRLIGRDARMADLLILLSTLGGIVLFGAVGFIVGPIVAALFVTAWHIYGAAFQGWLLDGVAAAVTGGLTIGLDPPASGGRDIERPGGPARGNHSGSSEESQ